MPSTGPPTAASCTTTLRACSSRISDTTRSNGRRDSPVTWVGSIRRRAMAISVDPLDGVQRHHHHRSRCGPAAGRAPAVQAGRETTRADHVGGVRVGGDPEGALGRAGRDPTRDLIVATRDGFHGKKGLAEAVTGSERDKNRDPRVRFVIFSKDECHDLTLRDRPFDPARLSRGAGGDQVRASQRMACLITEPYLGGGGSYHPPAAYLQLLQDFCRANDILFILDEVQSNFGRTGEMFAFETYGLEPESSCWARAWVTACRRHARRDCTDVFRALGLRRSVRYVQRQSALLCRRAGHARHVRRP